MNRNEQKQFACIQLYQYRSFRGETLNFNYGLIYKLQNIILSHYFRLHCNFSEFFRNVFVSRSTNFPVSDSQLTNYEKFVQKTLEKNHYFVKFRRKYTCRQIIETVEPDMGYAYFKKILALNPGFSLMMDTFKKNDLVGKPLTFNYPNTGPISPTTLRYISVAAELEVLFGSLNEFKIAEIGCGYGGQLRILDSLYEIKEYHLYDLENVQTLTLKYLSNFDVRVKIIRSRDLPNKKFDFDLVISNYAFSELPRFLQSDYLQKVILKSKRGYMTMNTGKNNLTGRSRGKYSIEELIELIPNSRVLAETPLTGIDNYLLIWN